MHKRALYLAVTLLAILVSSTTVYAGAVYVPVAADVEIEGIRYTTRVLISNTTDEIGRFSTFYIPRGVDGTERPDEESQIIPVSPGGTFVMNSIVPEGEMGMLEINASPRLAVAARLVATLEDGTELLGTELPVISSENLLEGGREAHLLGWTRASGNPTATNLGVINLDDEINECSLKAVRSNGEGLGGTVVVPLLPLSQFQVLDALGLIGLDDVKNTRGEVRCEGRFYAFATILDGSDGDTVFIAPSATGTSELLPPGEERPCPANAECFTEDGTFHVPEPGNRVRRLTFDVPPGDYSSVRAELDVTLGDWAPGNTSGLHNIFWLARDRNRDLIGYINVFGPNRSNVLIRHGLGVRQEDKARVERPLALQEGTTYHFDYLFDPSRGLTELVVSDASGQVIGRFSGGTPNVPVLRIRSQNLIHVDFGFTGVNPNEPPTFGWQYKNLRLEFVR